MDTQLNFINRSNETNNSKIVIFQKNVGSGAEEVAVAWKVIEQCGLHESHPFTYTETMQVSSSDSWGNYTPLLDAQHGHAFTASMTASGDTLTRSGQASYPTEVQVLNNLATGSINAGIYKAGSLLARKSSIAPQQMAAFEFKPTIWIGAVSEVQQGKVMNSAVVDSVNTELSLLGIASADIVMTGGGPGANSRPFAFALQNVVMA